MVTSSLATDGWTDRRADTWNNNKTRWRRWPPRVKDDDDDDDDVLFSLIRNTHWYYWLFENIFDIPVIYAPVLPSVSSIPQVERSNQIA